MALDALLLVREGGYSQRVLDRLCWRARLSPRDRRLAWELTLGTLRWRGRLSAALNQQLEQGLESLPDAAQELLLMSAYQLFFLSKIPAHAAIFEGVELAKLCARGLERLVNGVLRSLDRDGIAPSPELQALLEDPEGAEGSLPLSVEGLEALAEWLSAPSWWLEQRIERNGLRAAIQLAERNNEPAPLTITPTPGVSLETLTASLERDGAQWTPGRFASTALHLELERPFQSRSFRNQLWFVQDEAAQLVCLLASERPAQRVWDMCAAPGGKSLGLLRALSADGSLLATDVHEGKVEALRERLGQDTRVRVLQHDGRRPMRDEDPFDLIVVDAPCSALGLLRRHPEIRWRRGPAEVEALAHEQARLLDIALRSLKPNGVLVYSVCTDSPEEGDEQIQRLLERRRTLSLALPTGAPWDTLTRGRFGFNVGPGIEGCDGFFFTRLQLQAEEE
ncbi:MAG: transcription antitermination factor NusB [Myxococcota bacterium]|nr:transcription antitermination factor NusB [Myxococcota bacterium]